MQKEGSRSLINSQDGKIKIVLLFSIALIFILTMFYAEAVAITLFTPGNFTFNSTGNNSLAVNDINTRNTIIQNISFMNTARNLHPDISATLSDRFGVFERYTNIYRAKII